MGSCKGRKAGWLLALVVGLCCTHPTAMGCLTWFACVCCWCKNRSLVPLAISPSMLPPQACCKRLTKYFVKYLRTVTLWHHKIRLILTKFTIILPEPTAITAVTPVGYWLLCFWDSNQNWNLQPSLAPGGVVNIAPWFFHGLQLICSAMILLHDYQASSERKLE